MTPTLPRIHPDGTPLSAGELASERSNRPMRTILFGAPHPLNGLDVTVLASSPSTGRVSCRVEATGRYVTLPESCLKPLGTLAPEALEHRPVAAEAATA